MPRKGDKTPAVPAATPAHLALPAPVEADAPVPAGGGAPAPADTGEFAGAPAPAEASVRPRRWVFVLAILVLTTAGVAGFLKGSFDHRNEPGQLLSDAFRRVRDADTPVARVDEAVRAGVSVTPAAVDAAGAGIPAGRESLLTALDGLSRAEHGLRGRELERARALRKAAEGRLAMLRSAALLLPLQSRAATAYTASEDGWASVRTAAALADEAALAFNAHTRAGVESSTVLTQRAESELASGYAALLAASRVMPEADLKATLEYVAGKRRIAAASREVDAVWLRGDVAGANGMVERMVASEAPLEALLARLPKTPGSAVRTALDTLSADLADDYAIGQRLAREGDEDLAAVPVPHPSE